MKEPRHAIVDDQPRDDRRRDGVAQPRERVRQTLREAAAADRRPALHRARRDRERRAFADADQQPAHEQRRQAAGEAGEDRGRRPDQAAEKQRPPRTEAIADPAAENLEHQIRITERRLQEAQLYVRERQLPPDRVGGGGNVDAIDVRDQIHHAQEPEDDGGRLRPLERGHSSGHRLHQRNSCQGSAVVVGLISRLFVHNAVHNPLLATLSPCDGSIRRGRLLAKR